MLIITIILLLTLIFIFIFIFSFLNGFYICSNKLFEKKNSPKYMRHTHANIYKTNNMKQRFAICQKKLVMIVTRKMLAGISHRVITNACHFIMGVVEMKITLNRNMNVQNIAHRLLVRIRFIDN